MQSSSRRNLFPVVRFGLLFGFLLSLVVGLLAYYIAKSTIEHENEARFRNMAHVGQSTLNARIKSYTTVLRATASLFDAEPKVTREKFRRFFEGLNLKENYPAIETLNYAGFVRDQDRDAFETKVRQELGLDAPFAIKPPGRRPVYAPVVFIEPEEVWVKFIGNDVASSPVALKANLEARDSGHISTSGAPVGPMRDKKRLGLALRIPVYQPGAPVDTVDHRRAAYIGSVGIAFSVKKLVAGVLEELPLKTVRLSLYNHPKTLDPGAAEPSQLIYDSSSDNERPMRTDDMDDPAIYHVQVPVDFNGLTWDAHFSIAKEAVDTSGGTSFPLLTMLAGFATSMLLYGVLYTLTSSRARAVELAKEMTQELRESQEQLMLSHQKLRQLTAHTEQIKEFERKRIAREIHDDLGQNLLALRIDAQMLSSRTREGHPRLHARVEATLGQIDATIKSVRQIINDLRPNVLDLGLNAAVDWQIAEFQRRSGIQCDLVEYHKEIAVDDHCSTALFRILQESLTNVRRHARASWVRVDLRVDHGFVLMSVRDNGVGVQGNPHKPGAFGLIGIEERVAMLGGTFSVTGSPGGGTTVEVAIPAHQHSHQADDVHAIRELQDNAPA